jgi:hypothetical protein
MATQIQLTRSGTAAAIPTAAEMELGEVALNYADGKLFFKNNSGQIEQLNSTYNNSGKTIFVNDVTDRVGLNTVTPNFLLDLGGDTASTANTLRLNQNDDGTAIRIGGSANGDITLLRVDNLDGITDSSAEGFSIKYLGSNSNNELAVFTDNQSGSAIQALTILQNGNIGVGVATPAHELDVAGTIRVTNSTNFITFNDGSENMGFILNNAGKLAINAGGTTDVLQLQTNGGTRFHIDNVGNVGIGTTSPDKLLVVDGADAEIVISDTNSTPLLRLRENGVTKATVRTSSGSLIFDAGGTTERMRINSTGEVGIGKTATAGVELDVNGDIKATGTATAATPTASTHLTTKAYVDSLISTVQHTGSAVTQISGCTISRTSAGLYTITLDTDSGQLPTAVAGLSTDFELIDFTAEGDAAKMNGEFSISAKTVSNTRVDIEISELVSLRGTGGGNDGNTTAEFVRSNVDTAFQVLITNR